MATLRDPRPARRANLDGPTAKEGSAHREDWRAEVGHSARSRSECVLSPSRRTPGGHVAARKAAIHSAVLEAARGA